jgi:tetratricopeptide (TPR) repeat protein
VVRGAACAAALLAASAARAQQVAAPQEEVSGPSIDQYLTDRGLNELLAVYLLQRLKVAEGDVRVKLADRLGSIYVQMLDKATTPEARREWEARSQDLLRAVPEAESFELRLNLGKAQYLRAEDIAERWRLRLATPEEKQESETTLRAVNVVFKDIGTKVNRRVEQLERREATGRDEDEPAVRAELSEARRLRSLAMYYAGWSEYYIVMLAGRGSVDEAMAHFGWLLNASGGRQANVERVPASLLRYEHIARAALGCALCESIRGRDGAAMLWLDAVEHADGIPPAIAKQLFSRRIVVYARAKRWGDLEHMVKNRREPGKDKPTAPLDAGEARLLAVVALEALDDGNLPPGGRDIVQNLADTAMTDLITLGEVRQVQDLVGKFGSAHLGGEGFIVQYIRGLQTYDRARAAHAATGKNVDDPTAEESVGNLYREAAASLQIAVNAKDAARYADERSNAGLVLGLSLFYAGDLKQAADRFEEAFRAGTGGGPSAGPIAKRTEDALWLAIVSLDKAVEGGTGVLKERLTRLSALFLQTFPKSERAARLLLRQAGADLVSEDRAVSVLLGVPKE